MLGVKFCQVHVSRVRSMNFDILGTYCMGEPIEHQIFSYLFHDVYLSHIAGKIIISDTECYSQIFEDIPVAY